MHSCLAANCLRPTWLVNHSEGLDGIRARAERILAPASADACSTRAIWKASGRSPIGVWQAFSGAAPQCGQVNDIGLIVMSATALSIAR